MRKHAPRTAGAPVPVAPSLEKISLDEPESVVPADLAMSPKSSADKEVETHQPMTLARCIRMASPVGPKSSRRRACACTRSGTMLLPTSRLPERVTAPMASRALNPAMGRKARGCGEVRGWSSSTQPNGETQTSPWSPTPASAIRRRA